MLRFSDLRGVLSLVDRVSIVHDDCSYDNYSNVRQVPEDLDQSWVKGIGLVESEFPIEGDLEPWKAEADRAGGGDWFFAQGIEVWVAGDPGPVDRLDAAFVGTESSLQALSGVGGGLPGGLGRILDWSKVNLVIAQHCIGFVSSSLERTGGGASPAIIADMKLQCARLRSVAEGLEGADRERAEIAQGRIYEELDYLEGLVGKDGD